MFKKILIANRDEVAVRIIRACKNMNIRTVSVCSSADLEALHTNLAHESYCIGPPEIEKSYCNIDAILCAAVNSGADAIHPGYGFLADSAELSRRCRELGITFIGAPPELMEICADDQAAAAVMKEAGIPTSYKKLKSSPKLVDIQIARDNTGRIVIVGDRDTSISHDTNRLMGEAPAYGILEKVRKKLYKAATAAAEVLDYVGIGSINFFVDKEGNFCFDRFVPRLQVGCAITELQSRIDLVHWQIRLAAGDIMNFSENTLCRSGHAIGCRIFAVHPDTHHPSAGKLNILHVPGGICVQFDTAMYQGCTIPREYQPLIGKLIVYARTRPPALQKMKSALKEIVTDGVYNNSENYYEMLGSEAFVSGEYDINSYRDFLEAKQDI